MQYSVIFCSMRMRNRVAAALSKTHHTFLVLRLGNCVEELLEHFCGTRQYKVTNNKDLRQWLERLDDVAANEFELKHGNIQGYSFCFLAVSLRTLYFKRTWQVRRGLIGLIPAGFKYQESIRIRNNAAQIDFCSVYGRPRRTCSHRTSLHLLPCGYGDFFNMLPVLRSFVSDQKKKGCKTEIIYGSRESYRLGKAFLQAEHTLAGEKISRFYYSSSQIVNVQDIPYLASNRLYDLARFLQVDDRLEEAFADRFAVCRLHGRICSELKRLRQDNIYVIGVQFYSKNIEQNDRNYPPHHIERFVDLCRQNSIGVVNLAPCPYQITGWTDLGDKPLKEIVSIAGQLDAMVCIDSCCAHIAGLLGKPSLILYKKIFAYTLCVCRMNFNLVSHSGDLEQIKPNLIFEYLIRLLQENLPLSNNIKRDYQSFEKQKFTII